MRTNPTGRRLALCVPLALAGLLIAASARPVAAADGVARASDKKTGVVPAGHTEACAVDPCSDAAACNCGNGCCCGKGGVLGRLFGGKKNCRCGNNCCCKNGCGRGGLIRCCGKCDGKCDLNGDGYADPIGDGVCRGCGAHGSLFGHGYCGKCCGMHTCCLPGIPCCLGIPCLGIPCCAGQNGALGGCYSRVYALNPYYHDFRDGAVYAAQGYNAPIAVPLAPNVDYTYNYGWGLPSSRLTPVSRVVPSPYGPQPQFAVPPGYVPAGAPAGAYAVPPGAAPAPPANGNGNGQADGE